MALYMRFLREKRKNVNIFSLRNLTYNAIKIVVFQLFSLSRKFKYVVKNTYIGDIVH